MQKRNLIDWEQNLVDDLEKKALEIWSNEQLRWSNEIWTKEFKNILGIHAFRNNCFCRMSNQGGEFLWDVSWLKSEDNTPVTPFELILSCEIEWNGGDEAIIDFRKLVVSTAPYLVIIFDKEWHRDGGDRYNKKIDAMKKIIPSGTGKKFLFIGIKSSAENNTNSRILDHEELEVL
jgi:hypothetical protein